MVTFAQLRDADFGPVEEASRAWQRFSASLQEAQTEYQTKIAGCVKAAGWEGKPADAASTEMQPLLTKLQTAASEAGSVANLLHAGHGEFKDAQDRLKAAINDAASNHLRVGDDGSLSWPPMSAADRRDPESQRQWAALRDLAEKIKGRFGDALRLAAQADERLNGALSGLGADSLDGKGDLATQLAQRLLKFDQHAVNLPPELIEYARQMAKKYGISDRLMLMTLWQEQQWYQNYGQGSGPIGDFGRWLNETGQSWAKDDKSMGVAHMKPQTALDILSRDGARDESGRLYSSYSTDEIAAKLENNPRFAVETSARYLSQIQNETVPGHQGWSDKQTFMLYAADDQNTRDRNLQFGDSTEGRQGAIHARAVNWDRVYPAMDDEQLWERLSPADRQRALAQIGAQQYQGNQIPVNTPFAPHQGVETVATGTKPYGPGMPSPHPAPSPTPPSGR